MSNNWETPTNPEAVARRAGGRRAYNFRRRVSRAFRLKSVVELVGRYGFHVHGSRARIAQELGVHRSTITRDLQYLLRESRDPLRRPFMGCPCCGGPVPTRKVKRFLARCDGDEEAE